MSKRRIINFKSLKFAILRAIVLSVSLLSIVVIARDIAINTNRTEEQAKNSSSEIGNQVVMNYENYLNSKFNTITYLEVELMNHNDLNVIKNRFDIIQKSRTDIVHIILCNIDGETMASTGLSLHSSPDNIKQIYGSSSKYSFSSPYMIDGEYKILVGNMIMHSVGGEFENGILLVEYNFQTLVNISKSTNLGDGGALYILDSDYTMIYSMQNGTSPYLRDAQLYCIEDLIIGNSILKHSGNSYSIYVQTLTNTRWKIAICANVSASFKSQTVYDITIIGIAILILLFSFIIASWISKRVTNPIAVLEKSMKKLEEGNFDIVSEIDEKHSQVEIVRLNKNFNNMITQIRKLMDKVVEEQTAQRKSELKALQNQINPHFLYNTLDSIVFMAESNQVDEVKRMVVALAKFFRISISKGKPIITVQEELEHVKNYMIIESIRYKDTFTFQIDCEEECKNFLAMKLMLQPFVENSIYHGLNNLEEKGLIHIKVYQEDGFLYFVVKDNGYGMRQSKIDELYERMHNNEVTNSVGIKNVYQRLKLYYGPTADIKIESVLDEYTKFFIKTPMIKEEQNEKNS
jgi:two-component system sensor histidine kinase YesM